MNHVIKKYDDKTVQVTVEERDDGVFIATVWDKNDTRKADREVYEFETFGGAVDRAFDIMAAYLKEDEWNRRKAAV